MYSTRKFFCKTHFHVRTRIKAVHTLYLITFNMKYNDGYLREARVGV